MKEHTGPYILVPLDGSPTAERVLPHAVRLATALGSGLLVFRVAIPLRGQALLADVSLRQAEDPALHRYAAEEYLEGVYRRLAEEGAPTRYEVGESLDAEQGLEQAEAHLVGAIAEAIVQRSQAEDVDFVAMTTHGASGSHDVPWGSVAWEVLTRIQKPVFLISERP